MSNVHLPHLNRWAWIILGLVALFVIWLVVAGGIGLHVSHSR